MSAAKQLDQVILKLSPPVIFTIHYNEQPSFLSHQKLNEKMNKLEEIKCLKIKIVFRFYLEKF